MTINKQLIDKELVVALEGRLDTNSSPQLEAELKQSLEGIETLIFDLKQLAYISSAGLRVLLTAQKVMNKQGTMAIRNANRDIMDVFYVTGFINILKVEQSYE